MKRRLPVIRTSAPCFNNKIWHLHLETRIDWLAARYPGPPRWAVPAEISCSNYLWWFQINVLFSSRNCRIALQRLRSSFRCPKWRAHCALPPWIRTPFRTSTIIVWIPCIRTPSCIYKKYLKNKQNTNAKRTFVHSWIFNGVGSSSLAISLMFP